MSNVAAASLEPTQAREGANVQGVSTAIKVGAILVMSTLLLATGSGFAEATAGKSIWPAAWNGSLFAGVGLAMIGVLWAYEGWQYVTFSAGETKNPQRTFPLGICVGTALLIGIYVFANVGYIAALGPEEGTWVAGMGATALAYGLMYAARFAELARNLALHPDARLPLAQLRAWVDAIDHDLGVLVQRRLEVARVIGDSKRQTGRAVLDPRREAAVRRTYVEALPANKVLADKLVDLLLEAAKAQQSIDD